MKNKNPFVMPHFQGLPTKDPNTFLFKFEVPCRTYDHKTKTKKLRFFPSTLKEETLGWFMSLDGNNINTWETSFI